MNNTPLPRKSLLPLALVVLFAAGCASQSPPVTQKESEFSLEQQKAAQEAAMTEHDTHLALKRKIALGRITNETLHGKSLLRDSSDDVLGKQVTDMLSKALTESGNFLVFERPDIQRLKDEAELTGSELNLVGVDALVIGSLTEFGRRTTGESGFLSSSKKQTAYAKVDLRLVDAATAQVTEAFSGAGESAIENVSVAGFGSRADYDASINDRAISLAIADAVDTLTRLVSAKPWQADILAVENGQLFISGGKNQGVAPGMEFALMERGRRVKSAQTGFMIELPGKKVGKVKVVSLFGNSATDQGSVAEVIQGSLAGFQPSQLVVQEIQQ